MAARVIFFSALLLALTLLLGGCGGTKVSTTAQTETTEPAATAEESTPEPEVVLKEFVKVAGEPEQLTFGDYDNAFATFSPGGQRIAFQSLTNGRWQLYQIDLTVENTVGGEGENSGDGPKYLTIPLLQSEFNDESPVWASDGVRLLYVSDRGNSDPFDRDVMLYDPSQGTTVPLTNEPGDDWSPVAFGAERAAFISERGVASSVLAHQRPNRLYLVNLDGSDLAEVAGQEANYCSPVALDDNRLIVLNSEDRLVEINVNSSETKILTPSDIRCGMASFCPSVGWIVFTGRQDNSAGIYVLENSTGQMTRLESAPGEAKYPQISPDSVWLLYAQQINGTFQIFRVGLIRE